MTSTPIATRATTARAARRSARRRSWWTGGARFIRIATSCGPRKRTTSSACPDYRDRLLAHIESHPEFIQPPSRRNEILRLLEGGLEDISASRSRVPWGVPFPGDPDHTVYVWFDALPNYISAIGYPDEGFETWWPAALHVIGKDITRFHCVIWPAMLLSAGLPLPETVWAHGFLMIGGGKLSKSEAQLLDLERLIDRHGPDAFRYILLREAAWDSDRDFSSVEAFLEQFDTRYEADLANDLGNLLNRTVSMICKYRDGSVPGGEETDLDIACDAALEAWTSKRWTDCFSTRASRPRCPWFEAPTRSSIRPSPGSWRRTRIRLSSSTPCWARWSARSSGQPSP